MSDVVKALVRIGGVAHLSNGLTERANGILKGMLKMYTDEDQTDLDTYLPFVRYAYRSSYQSSLRSTPFGMLYGREPTLPLDTVLLEPEPTYTKADDYRRVLEEGLKRRYKWAKANLDAVQAKVQSFQTGAKEKVTKVPAAKQYKAGDKVMVHITLPVTSGERAAGLKHAWRGPYSVLRTEGRHT